MSENVRFFAENVLILNDFRIDVLSNVWYFTMDKASESDLKMRMRKKPNLQPRMEKCAAVQIAEPAALRGKWRESFPGKSLWLEIGCGKGQFTVGTAKENPEAELIALERVEDAMVIAMERACAEETDNVRFISMDALKLREVFAPGEVERIFVNFCDPWPTKRHAKRRLTHGNFLQLYRRVLPMGGEIHFKSDNDKLFEWSLEEIPQFGFRLSQVTRDLHAGGPVGVMTDYEAKFYQQGVTINRCVATMVPWEAPAQPEESDEA